jgi:hypothetical protein
MEDSHFQDKMNSGGAGGILVRDSNAMKQEKHKRNFYKKRFGCSPMLLLFEEQSRM